MYCCNGIARLRAQLAPFRCPQRDGRMAPLVLLANGKLAALLLTFGRSRRIFSRVPGGAARAASRQHRTDPARDTRLADPQNTLPCADARLGTGASHPGSL